MNMDTVVLRTWCFCASSKMGDDLPVVFNRGQLRVLDSP